MYNYWKIRKRCSDNKARDFTEKKSLKVFVDSLYVCVLSGFLVVIVLSIALFVSLLIVVVGMVCLCRYVSAIGVYFHVRLHLKLL